MNNKIVSKQTHHFVARKGCLGHQSVLWRVRGVRSVFGWTEASIVFIWIELTKTLACCVFVRYSKIGSLGSEVVIVYILQASLPLYEQQEFVRPMTYFVFWTWSVHAIAFSRLFPFFLQCWRVSVVQASVRPFVLKAMSSTCCTMGAGRVAHLELHGICGSFGKSLGHWWRSSKVR
jgi:hypothetical protein